MSCSGDSSFAGAGHGFSAEPTIQLAAFVVGSRNGLADGDAPGSSATLLARVGFVDKASSGGGSLKC